MSDFDVTIEALRRMVGRQGKGCGKTSGTPTAAVSAGVHATPATRHIVTEWIRRLAA